MKKIFPVLFTFLGMFAFSQHVKSVETIFNDKISIRAIELYDNKVWYSGTDSKFGFIDLKNPKNQKQIKLSEKKLQFRTLGQNKDAFYAINIESPAEFFKINKKSLKYEIVFKDTAKTAFYDALHFVNNDKAYAFSDLNEKRQFMLGFYEKGRWYKAGLEDDVPFNEGEAAFAASNTNIASSDKFVWIATGGKTSRIFRFERNNIYNWKFFNTPIIQGESSQGMYSIDFLDDKFGIAVGGDYTKQDANINNIATTNDGGETWQIQASGKNEGYTTCVKIKPNSKGKEIISVGDQHISYSSDFGKTWTKISDEKNLYVCEWVDQNTIIFAGKDRILKMKIN